MNILWIAVWLDTLLVVGVAAYWWGQDTIKYHATMWLWDRSRMLLNDATFSSKVSGKRKKVMESEVIAEAARDLSWTSLADLSRYKGGDRQ